MGRTFLLRVALAVVSLVLLPSGAQALTVGGVEVGVLVEGPGGLEVRRTLAPDHAAADLLAGRLRGREGVLAAEVDVELERLDEPLRPQQWPLDRLEAERAWAVTRGAGTVVAVIDSGVDAAHPDLEGALLPGLDLVDPSGDGRTDPEGHGTAVAGVIAARENDLGIAGLAPEVMVLPVRVTDENGTAGSTDVAEGMIWATDHGADVLNLSLGGPEPNALLEQAVAYAVERGVVVVAASGNSGAQGNPTIYPAAYPAAVAVGATDRADQAAVFTSSGDWVDLAAPGVDVVVPTLGGGWGLAAGTSFAAPHVAAAAGLLLARNPDLAPADVAAHLTGTAQDVAAPGRDPQTGAGLVAPVAALAAAPAQARPGTPRLQRVGRDADVVRAAVDVSREAFPADGTARQAVLGRDDLFADSLAGAALAGDAGPVLFTAGGPDAGLRAETAAELTRVLAPGRTVYLLGGEYAVSPTAERQVRDLGFAVVRLAGGDRFETALAVADQVDPRPERVLLARGDDWADALTGGAYAAAAGVPVLLTPSDALHPAVERALARSAPEVVLLGGPLALSEAVADAAARSGPTVRVAGANRLETAVAIARSLWGRTSAQAGDAYVAVEGFAADSWAPALSGAVLSADRNAPQLLLEAGAARTPAPTAAYLAELGYGTATQGTAILVGPTLTDAHAESLSQALGA